MTRPWTIAASLLLAGCLQAPSAHGAECDYALAVFQKGFTIGGWSRADYDGPHLLRQIRELKSAGVEWIALTPRWMQGEDEATTLAAHAELSPSDESLRHAIRLARGEGLHVFLKPVDRGPPETNGSLAGRLVPPRREPPWATVGGQQRPQPGAHRAAGWPENRPMEGKPSQTAVVSALMRASHLHLFEGPKIHEDTFALQLSGIDDAAALARFSGQLEQMHYPVRRVSAYFAFRQRFSEERMRVALDRGVDQVVLLGAGLDSFALRHPHVPTSIRFVEIDHPDTQRWKIERIGGLGLRTPGVHYMPVDLRTQSLETVLLATGIDPRRPAFFAWLGVTQYIPEEASYHTLSVVARHAPGSEIAFDVYLPADEQPADEREMCQFSAMASALRGEPWISYFVPEDLSRRLVSLGFGHVTRLTREDVRAYYAGQPADAQPVGSWQVIAAAI